MTWKKLFGTILVVLSTNFCFLTNEEYSLFYNGVVALSEERYDDAIAFFTLSNKQNPTHAGFLNLGLAYAKTKDWSSALWASEVALKYDPNSSSAANNAAFALKKINKDKSWSHPYSSLTKFLTGLDTQTWYMLTWFFSILTAIMVVLAFYPNSMWRSKNILFLLSILFLLLFLGTYFSGSKVTKHYVNLNYALPIHSTVKSYAREGGIKLNKHLEEGERYEILELRDQWVKLSYSDQKPVWVQLEDVRLY